MTGVLNGIRILDFSRLLPGPYCTWLLADQGAEVIRVENPRELAKQAKVFGWDKLDDRGRERQRSLDMLARGKKSIYLDIGSAASVNALRRLAATVDVLIEDYRPGVLAGLGLGYDDLSSGNPALVYTSVTLCGQSGPLRDKPGHDPVALALSGALSRSGENADAPEFPGMPAADILTGSHAAFATLAALISARASGKGQHVDVAMTDSSLSLVSNIVSRFENPDHAPPRGTRRADIGLWECADGAWICTTDMEPRYWTMFCEAMGRPDFIPWQHLPERRAEIRKGLEKIFASKPRDHWIAVLEAAGTQFAPVNSVGEAMREEHFRSRGSVVEATLTDGTTVAQLGPPVRLGNAGTPHPAVVPGTHTREILEELGLSAAEIDEIAQPGGRPAAR